MGVRELARNEEALEAFEREIALPMLVLSLAVVPLLVLPLVVDLSHGLEETFITLDWMVWAAFAVEYLIRLYLAPHKGVGRLGAAKRAGKLDDELERLRRIPLVCVDEVGYIPFDPEAAALFFALVSSRYERASLIVSSNKTFSVWAEIFGDPVAVAAMVDRLVHHAEVIVLKGESYRLKGRGKEVMASPEPSQL